MQINTNLNITITNKYTDEDTPKHNNKHTSTDEDKPTHNNNK